MVKHYLTMQVKFKSLMIEGFRSIVDLQEFDLDRPGLNMVKGVNGKGKTTLFEALIWSLYGANLKGTVNAKVQSWKEVQGPGFNGTYVSTFFSIDKDKYEILRAIKHSEYGDVLIVKKNSERIAELDKKDAQAYIDALLTMDFNTFMNSFMFGQRTTRLVEAKSTEKRKLFEELFDMGWIQNMRDRTVMDVKAAELVIYDAKAAIDRKQLSIGFHEDAVREAKGRLQLQAIHEDEIRQDTERTIADTEAKKGGFDEEKAYLEKYIADLPLTMGTITVVKDYTEYIVAAEGRLASINMKFGDISDSLNVAKGKLQSDQERLNNFDNSSYNDYLDQVTKLENKLKDIVSQLYPEDSGVLLSQEEQLEIQNDYEDALNNYNKWRNILSERQQSCDESGELVCPTCGRPFDNVDELAAHRKELQAKLTEAETTVASSEVKLDAARVDANLLKEYQTAEVSLRMINDHAPHDPEAAKAALRKAISDQESYIDTLKEQRSVQDKQAKAIEDTLAALETKQEAGRTQREKNREITDKQNALLNDIASCRLNIDTCNTTIEQLKKSLDNTELPKLQQELDEKQHKLKIVEQDKLNLERELEEDQADLAVKEFWLKDVFAANGLKAYILKAMLDQLNQHTAKYGAKLGCSMRFSLDLTKVSTPFSTICTLGDKINKDYKEFSGGEKQRLDIVLLLAMHDLLSSTTDINILILDEVFEGMDEDGVTTVLELLTEKSATRSIFVISHSPVIGVLNSNTIDIENEHGKTILS